MFWNVAAPVSNPYGRKVMVVLNNDTNKTVTFKAH